MKKHRALLTGGFTFAAILIALLIACTDFTGHADVALDMEDCTFPAPFVHDTTTVPLGCPYRFIDGETGDTILVNPVTP